MKTLTSALLLSATLISASAFAGDLDYPPVANTTSSVSRAQVQAELQQAQANGEIAFGELQQPTQMAETNTRLTRAAVQAEATRAKATGQIAFSGEGYPRTGG
jgi:hypothetical protein